MKLIDYEGFKKNMKDIARNPVYVQEVDGEQVCLSQILDLLDFYTSEASNDNEKGHHKCPICGAWVKNGCSHHSFVGWCCPDKPQDLPVKDEHDVDDMKLLDYAGLKKSLAIIETSAIGLKNGVKAKERDELFRNIRDECSKLLDRYTSESSGDNDNTFELPDDWHTMKVEIYYSDNGIEYQDSYYEADHKLEQRNISFLLSCFMKDLIKTEDEPVIPEESHKSCYKDKDSD